MALPASVTDLTKSPPEADSLRPMPILRGSVTFSRFQAEPLDEAERKSNKWLFDGLAVRRYEPIDRNTDQERAMGFVELLDHDSVEFAPGNVLFGEYALFGYRIDQLRISAAAIRAELEKWEATFQQEKERPPGRAEKAEAKGNIRQAMRKRAMPVTRVVDVSWNLQTRQVHIWAATRKLVEEVSAVMEKGFEIRLVPRVPVATAIEMGFPEETLRPTADLCWPGMEGKVRHGAA